MGTSEALHVVRLGFIEVYKRNMPNHMKPTNSQEHTETTLAA